MLMILGLIYIAVLLILGLIYIAALLMSDFVGCVVALCAAILFSFGWPGRRIALVMLLAGGVGALAAMAAFAVLLFIVRASAPPEAFAMWALGGFGWFGAAAGALAGAAEGVIAVVESRASRPQSAGVSPGD